VDMDTAFVTAGIHNSAFTPGMSPEARRKAMEHLAQIYGGIRPTWVLDSLVWQTPAAALRERERARRKESSASAEDKKKAPREGALFLFVVALFLLLGRGIFCAQDGIGGLDVGHGALDGGFAFLDQFLGAVEFHEADVADARHDQHVGRVAGKA